MVFEPSSFGRYVLLKRIAIGGMAEIFRAMAYGAEGFEKLVAIKRMLPHLSSDHQFVDMFVNEAKLAANLNHVNIVPIYDFGCIENMLFLSMEYVHGKDISEITRKIKSRRLRTPVELACHIFIDVLNGLHNAHNQRDRFGKPINIVHRDMSPPNIIVSYDGEVKIADFGIAKAARSKAQTSSGVLKGKYSYMSPEQARGKPLDHRTDIFSLGICFYEMLTLTEMFIGHSELEVLRKVREASYKPPTQLNSAIPKELEAILNRALKRNPEERYPSAADWRNELEGFLVSKNLRFSTSALSGFMHDMFKEDIAQEEAHLTKEAELAEKLRPEARHIAKMEASAAGELDTLVLGKNEEGWPPGLDKDAFGDVDDEDDEEETIRVELSALGVDQADLDQGPAYAEDGEDTTEVESIREEMETLKARRLAQYRVRYEDLDVEDTSPPTMESEALPRRKGVAEDKIPARLPPKPPVSQRAEEPEGLEDLFEEGGQSVPFEAEPATGELDEFPGEEDRKKKSMMSYLVLVVVGAVLGGGLVALLLSDSGSSETTSPKPAAVAPLEEKPAPVEVATATASPPADEAERAEEERRATEAKLAEEARKAEEAKKADEAAKAAEEAKKAEEAEKADEAAKAAVLLKQAEEEKNKKTVKKSKKRKKRRKRYTSRKKKRKRKYTALGKKKRYKKKKKSSRRRKTRKGRKKSPKKKTAKESAAPAGGNTLYIDGINVKTLPGLGKKLRPGVHIMELRGPDGKVLRRWRVRVKEEDKSK